MKIIGLIPCRLNSKRLPGKALLEIDGLPIIVHTAKRALLSKTLSEVYVCTDSKEIIKVCKKNNIKTIKTSSNFTNGTERIASVVNKFNCKLIIDIQGDEPLINPNYIDQVVKFHLKNKNKPDIIIPTIEIPYDSNISIVKVVHSKSNKILYLTRANVPFRFKSVITTVKKHLSVISFTPNALKKYAKLKETFLESVEGIELLRAIENDFKVYTLPLKGDSFSIDIKEDYTRALLYMQTDKFRKNY